MNMRITFLSNGESEAASGESQQRRVASLGVVVDSDSGRESDSVTASWPV